MCRLKVHFCISGSVEKREGKIRCSLQGASFAAERSLLPGARVKLPAAPAASLSPSAAAVPRRCERSRSVSYTWLENGNGEFLNSH